MSFFSLSLPSGRHRRRNGHYGSDYYKRRGLLGELLDIFSSVSGRRRGYYDYPPAPYPYPPNPQAQQPNQTPPPASTTPCANCNAQIPRGSKFCLNCGEKVSEGSTSAFCPNCGEGLLPNARFCQKCGVKVNQ